MIRSHLWHPQKWGNVEGLPKYARAVKDHAKQAEPIEEWEKVMASNETDDLY
jgi:hypothetical protein